jgi:hypothetical protein
MTISPLVDRAILRIGDRIGLPHQASKRVVKYRRVCTHPLESLRRWRMAATLAGARTFRLVPRSTGYARFTADALPGLGDAVAAAQAALREWDDANSPIERAKKPFFFNILTPASLSAHPALLAFVTSTDVIATAAGYFGQVPRLFSLGLFVSPTNESTMSSQMFHVDEDDSRQLKCFVNLDRVDADNGPFTFLPVAPTRAVFRTLPRFSRPGRLTDEQVFTQCQPEDAIALTGEAGSGAFVDTGRCLHFGSRTRCGRRVVLMFNYVPSPDGHIDKGKGEQAGYGLTRFPAAPAADPVRQLVLAPRR